MNKYNKWGVFKELWLLQWSNYWKDVINLMLGWVITILTLFVWLTFRDTDPNGMQYDPFVLAASIGIATIRNALVNVTRTIFLFKRTGIFNKLFATKVSKGFVFMCIIVFNQFTNLFVTVVLFSMGMLYPEQRQILGNINWLMVISGYILLIVISNLLAFIIAFTTKQIEIMLVIGNVFYFAGIYLLGLGLPLNVVNKSEIIFYITYLFPTKYALNIMQAGWVNDTSMSLQTPTGEIDPHGFGYGGNLFIPYLVNIVLIVICVIAVILIMNKKFGFGGRKYKRYINAKTHIAFISMIKKSKSEEELKQVIKMRDEAFNVKRKRRSTKGGGHHG